jgi:lipoprotein-releasing system permease protein
MKAVWLIAKSYFFSRKNPSAINIITGISLGGYALGAMSLLVLLSALNGFEDSIFGGIKATAPDLVVGTRSVVEGRGARESGFGSRVSGDGRYVCQSLIDKAIVKYGDKQTVARIWGVDSNFFKVYNADSLVVAGSAQLGARDAWMSESLVYQLNIEQVDRPVEVMTPSRTAGSLAQTTLNLEIKVNDPLKIEEVKGDLVEELGPGFKVMDRAEQHGTLYRMFNTEKWFSFALLAFVLLLISFNLFGSIRMMQIDKAQDLKMLAALGMGDSGLRWIFLLQAIWVALVGTVIGILLALGLIWVQLRFGLVTTQSSFEMVYPVSLRMGDIGLVAGLNLAIGLMVGVIASAQSSK